MTDLDKAREWAKFNLEKEYFNNKEGADEAAEIIQSLPDQWVDADKVQEEADRMDRGAENAMKPGHNEFSRGYAEAMQECAEHLRDLLTPSLPTLADMTQEEREACRWMQCMIADDTDEYCLLITVDDPCSSVLFQNSGSTIWNNDLITPLPDLPKLQWPGGVVDREIVDESLDDQAVAKDVCNSESNSSETLKSSIKPEDVPPNEPWLIEVDGWKAIGTRYKREAFTPWAVAALNGLFANDYNDNEVTLIHKLVPETHALPVGMRLADHEEYGRVVVSPKVDPDGDYKVFYSNDSVEEVTGAGWGFAHESELTFLDGVDA